MTVPVLAALALVRALSSVVPQDSPGAPHMVLDGVTPAVDLLPLKEHLADVEIAGVVAHVRLTQRYQNTGQATLHATYVFPGSTDAAVHAMRMTVGTRQVRAVLKERREAQQDHDRARRAGKTTSLLTQERPNVLTMRVANIRAQDVVTVELEYSELIHPTDGLYTFTLPAVVGPRFPGTPSKTSADVPDAPLHPGPTHRHDVAVHLLAPLPLQDVHSPTHRVGVAPADGVTHVVLDDAESNPGNRDFVLRYRLAGGGIQTGVLVHQGDPHNTLLALIQPPQRVHPGDVPPREYIFVVDVSGSMEGEPLAIAARLLQHLVTGLRSQDTFNLVLFESAPHVLAPQSVPATPARVDAAIRALNGQYGGGGTQLLEGLETALNLPSTPGTSRSVVVITDGYVTVEADAMRLIQSHLGDMNVFAFGIGRSVNRHLIEALARAGRGEPFVVLSGVEAASNADRFWEYVRAPVMTDVKVRFEGLEVTDVTPASLPDVFASRPVEVMAHFQGPPRGDVVVTGSTPEGRVELRVPVASVAGPQHPVLPLLWARQRIQDLTDTATSDEHALRRAVLPVALEHGVLGSFTAFVAVDGHARGDGTGVPVDQPSPLPAGLAAVFASGSQSNVHQAMGGLTGAAMQGGGIGYGRGGMGVGGLAGKASVTRSYAASVRQLTVGPVVTGNVAAEPIRRFIREHMPELVACYELGRAGNPALQGELTLTFSVDNGGRVSALRASTDTLQSPAVTTCVLRTFGAFRLPSNPREKAVFTYPLVFRPPT